MNKSLVLMFFWVMIISSCKKEEVKSPSVPQAEFQFESKASTVQNEDELFQKNDDESCETTEEKIEKVVVEKQNEAFQLQGGDTGCDPNQVD
jgi:biopolymer transport protein ExbD